MKYNKTCPNNCGNNKGIFKKDYVYCPYCKEQLIPKTIVSKNNGKYCIKKKCEHYVSAYGSHYCNKYIDLYSNGRELVIYERSLCGKHREKTTVLKERYNEY